MTDDPPPPTRGWRVYVVVLWVSIVLFFGTAFALMAVLYTPPAKPAPSPAPWSCSSEMAQVAPVDGGGQIAPLCGATAYPDAP